MSARLRLAERQGLLQNRHLSAVQVYALSILNFIDEKKEFDKEKENFKLALTSRQGFAPEKIFPEYFPPKEAESSEEMAAASEVDYSGVEWKSGSDSMAEFERIMAQLGNKGSVSGEDLAAAPGEAAGIAWTDWA